MKKSIFLFLLFALIPVAGCYAEGPWKGKVIDAETKQPIEGAAVVAVWDKELRGPAGGETRFLDAVETVTNKDGVFQIPANRFLSMPLLRQVKGPFFTIFKPGYGSFPKYQVSPTEIPDSFFSEKEGVVELPKLTTKEERLKKLIYANEPFSDHNDKKKRFIHILNEEFIELGLEPYKEEKLR